MTLNHQLHPLGPDDAGTQAERKARFSGGALGRSRTCGPRLRRPEEPCPGSGKASQPLATIRDDAASESRPSPAFAPVTENSADRLRTLLTVREVAAYLRVSTATVYELCARGRLRHIRVLNAIRVAPCDVRALLLGG